ncbi:MAG: branched-chain amino acid ABC transporter ATP-binding protein/permease [Betaproteobacteria bacterium]|nr:MAG: branched-chain amino acid ABC transporter ATP-binding protein/permease [Betaproteobacteria bacterium]
MRTLGALVAAGVALAGVPLLELPAFYESFFYLVFFWTVLATSWNILSGYSGYFSFGHGAFFGTGMYTTATLTMKAGMPFLWTLPVCAGIAALFGVAIGAVVFRAGRLRGELFALLTLAVSYVLATVILNTPIDGGPGVSLAAVAIPRLAATPPSTFYLLALAAAIVTLAVAYQVQYSPLGRGLFAIHDDEDVAEVLGVPTYRYKLAALAISCALAGVAGGIHALFVSYVTVGETFSIVVPLSVVLMSVLGGTRHWLGPAIGAALITALLYAFTASDYAVAGRAAVGLILIVVILFMPQGVLGQLLRWTARPQPKPGSGLEFTHRHAAIQDLTPLLSATGVSKAFAGVQALAGVDLVVRRGEILGLVGPNGSGKSTLINVVSGHYRADSGRVVFAGSEIERLSAHRIARLGIARTYQIPRPFAHLSVLENVTLPAMFGHAALARAEAEREAMRWLEYTGLAPKALVLPGELNLHQRKFLELARALAARPQLLLLDEVLSGLTPSEIDGAITLVRDIRAQGASIVFVEHVMRAVMQLADRIVVLSYGRVIAEGSPAEVMGRPAVVEAYLGKAHA